MDPEPDIWKWILLFSYLLIPILNQQVQQVQQVQHDAKGGATADAKADAKGGATTGATAGATAGATGDTTGGTTGDGSVRTSNPMSLFLHNYGYLVFS